MNLPSLPTDNLYKFIFISGVILFVYSMYSLMQIENKLRDSLIENTHNTFKLRFENDSLQIILGIDSALTNKAKLHLEEKLKKRKIEDDIKVYTLIKRREQSVELDNKLQNINDSWENKQIRQASIMLGTSVFLILFGGLLWYSKVQYYEDAILKLQYKKLKKELD